MSYYLKLYIYTAHPRRIGRVYDTEYWSEARPLAGLNVISEEVVV